MVKSLKTSNNEKNLKRRQRKKTHAKERNMINVKTDFLSESIKAKRQWHKIFNTLSENIFMT